MSEKYNATCAICGQPYKICRTCQEIKSFTPWRTITDTLQHYTLFLILSEYSRTKAKAKAKDELSKCDLSEKELFKDSIKNMIDEIMKEDVIKIVEETSEETVEENVEIKPQKSTRKGRTSVKQSEVTNDDIE